MDIRHLINLLPSYYKEFDSYKVEGKGLLERFLEIIGNLLYKVKENIDGFINVISISKTKSENLDLLASNVGGLPFTGKNVVTSLKLTDAQRRELIACSTYLVKNRGSREFFETLFSKLSNSDNNLAITISESRTDSPGYVNTVVDYYKELDNSNLDITNQTDLISTVKYIITGNFTKSLNKAISDVVYNFSPFNVKPLVYINGEFQSQLDTPIQLSIEYFNKVANSWEKVPDTFNLGSDTNYFRVVAYNTNTGKLVKGISITSKYESNSTKLLGTNAKDKLVTPYYYELKSLPDGINNFSRTFYPVPTVQGSGEDLGSGVKVKYLVNNSSNIYQYNVEVISLIDTANVLPDGTISIAISKYGQAVIAVRATRTIGGSQKVLSVIQHNNKHIVAPTSIWYNQSTGDYTQKEPSDLNGYQLLENVSLFVLDKFTDYTFSPVNNRSSKKVVKLVESKASLVGKIMVRQVYPITTKWVRSLRAIIQEDVMGNRVIPKINILVLNPHLPNVWLEDGTLLTANMVFEDLLSGTNTDWKIDTKRNTKLAIEVWKKEFTNGSVWLNTFTREKGSSHGMGLFVPIYINTDESCKIVSVEYPDDILPATITGEVVKAPKVIFKEHPNSSISIEYTEGYKKIGANIHVKVGTKNEAFAGKNGSFFTGKPGELFGGLNYIDMSKVVLLVQSPNGKNHKLDIEANSTITDERGNEIPINSEGNKILTDSKGNKYIQIRTDEYVITYTGLGNDNTVDVLSNLPGRFTFKVISHVGTEPISVDVLDSYNNRKAVHNDPSYVLLSSNKGRLQRGKLNSFLYVTEGELEGLYLSWQPMDSEGSPIIPYTKLINLVEGSSESTLRSFDIKTDIPVTKYGPMYLTLKPDYNVIHVVYILKKPIPTARLSISPTSIHENEGKSTTINIIADDPKEANNFSALCMEGRTGETTILRNGDKFTVNTFGKHPIWLMYKGEKVNPSSPIIFEVTSDRPGTRGEPGTDSDILVVPDRITFDNSTGIVDYELYNSRGGTTRTGIKLYGFNEVTRTIDIQTTEEWTLTLEDQ